ncbi:MAG: Precorrin-2 methylase [Thermodesulfobacteria bacterium]|nr:precorrin-2 C(20)-methyltransferase [Thermodesulfobacteriota bacterium]MCU4138380.1 Precorrin-2 methylase [Thermodesulfobacteriota bacterium]
MQKTTKKIIKLYVIGVGPGDPELLTLKAKKILKRVPLIFSPTGGKDNLALSIIKKAINLNKKKVVSLLFPMKKTKETDLEAHWKILSDEIIKYLNFFGKGAFITLGDPAFYSTFFYLYPFLKNFAEIEIVPGVSSLSAVASVIPINLSIADEKIIILPANYADNLEKYGKDFDTLILMKPHKNWQKILKLAENLKNYQSFYVKKATMLEEKIYTNLKEVPEEELDYFSIVIFKKREN